MTVHTYLDPAQVSVTLRAGGHALTTPRGWLTVAALAAAGTWAVHTIQDHPAACLTAVSAFALGLGAGYARGRRLPGRAVLTTAIAVFTTVGTVLALTMTATPLALRVLVAGVLWALAASYTALAVTQAHRDHATATTTATTTSTSAMAGAVVQVRAPAALSSNRGVDPGQERAAAGAYHHVVDPL